MFFLQICVHLCTLSHIPRWNGASAQRCHLPFDALNHHIIPKLNKCIHSSMFDATLMNRQLSLEFGTRTPAVNTSAAPPGL